MSNAVVEASSGSAFAQQGAVDWVALSKSTLSFSVEVLSRFSKAGVELITVAIGQAIFSGFNVPPNGQQRLAEAIAKLKAFASYGDVLWFGFGVKHITRILCKTEQGATCVAICACLSVSYDSYFASQVLKAVTDQSKTPGTLTPALPQWAALFNVCAGAVTDSQFPNLVEGFSRLIRGTSHDCTRQPLHTPTTAKSLAGALKELSKVSNGTLRSVTFEGGLDCGWLAAVAQWLLSLRVEIIDSSGNRLFLTSSENGSYAQVRIIQHLNTTTNDPGARTLSKSYFVQPGELCFGISNRHVLNGIPNIHIYSYGRSEWNNILKSAFGAAASAILHPDNAGRLAIFLCSGFQNNQEGITVCNLNPWGNSYITGCYQRRREFLNFSAMRLPELSTIFQHAEMNPQVTYGYTIGGLMHGEFCKSLAEICPCSRCSTKTLTAQETLFCLHRIGATIFHFLWILSWLDIDTSIKPSPSGLLMLYYTPIYGDESPGTLKGRICQRDVCSSLLPLFTGTTNRQTPSKGTSAIADNGICIYSSPLNDPEVDPCRFLRHRVVIGQIEREGSIYRKVSDTFRISNADRLVRSVPDLQSRVGPTTRLLLVVDETLNSDTLEANFHVETKIVPLQIPEPFVHQQFGLSHYDNTGREPPQNPPLTGKGFGVCEMRDRITGRIRLLHCSRRRVELVSSKRLDKLAAPWTGRCSDAVSALWRSPIEVIESLPKEGDWLLRCSILSGCCVELLPGNYSFLYTAMSYLHNQAPASVSLTFITSCLLCSTQRSDFGHYALDARISSLSCNLPISVYSSTNTKTTLYELASSVRYFEAPPIATKDMDTKYQRLFPQKSLFYQRGTKRTLQKFLRRRGIPFQKSITKGEMILKLQEHDKEHIDAAREDGFEAEDGEEAVDAVMSG